MAENANHFDTVQPQHDIGGRAESSGESLVPVNRPQEEGINAHNNEPDNGAFAARIKALYVNEDFPGAGQGLTAFYKQLKQTGKNEGRSLQDIKNILLRYPAYVQQIPAKVHFPTRHVNSLGSGLQVQVDLGEFPTSPRGSNYLMLMVDIFSQYYYGKCLEDKNSSTTTAALADILEENQYPLAANLQSIGSDWGGEFQSEFARFCERKNIRLFYFRGRNKAAFAEHGLRVVKAKIYTLARGQFTDQWDLLVPSVLATLNRTYNSALDCTPEEANSVLNGERVREALARNRARRDHAASKKYARLKEPEFAIGNYVYLNYKRPAFNAKESDSQRGQASLCSL